MNWAQLKTILWLRWRLTRNQWRKSGGIGAAIALIAAFALGSLGLLGMVFGVGIGAGGLGAITPMAAMFIFLGLTTAFIFFWLIGLLNELQRSETIDLQRLMHLPVQLGQIFVVNYVASHLAFSIFIIVPTMIGMSIGMAWTRGPSMLLLIPLGLSMVFMITAWTYLLRGWLATLMSNPRKRRAVIMGLSFAVILLVQAPNLYFNVFRRHETSRERAKLTTEQKAVREAENQQQLQTLLFAEKVVPPLWVPAGAKALAEGNALPALGGLLGCLALGTIGLRRAYASTVRFYLGRTGAKASTRAPSAFAPSGASARPVGTPRPLPTGPTFLERRIPFVPEQAAALALATLRSMLRAPEIKMQWGSSFVVMLIVGGSMLMRGNAGVSETAKPFIATGIVAFALFFMVSFLANQFGFDRDGFRALVLSPADRKYLLIGKNLACFPAPATIALLQLTAVSIFLRISPIVFLAAMTQLTAGLLLMGLAGNLVSILMPYRIQPGTMKPTKMPGLAIFLMVIVQMMFPLAMAPLFTGPLAGWLWQRAGGPPAGVVNLGISLVIAAVVVLIYLATLSPLANLLQRRETKILATVTAEIE